MVIDDDATQLNNMVEMLEEAGHTVTKLSDPANARHVFDELQPDLVILEVRSDQGQGWDVLSDLSLETPVVVVSAASREEDIVRGLEIGAADYLAKPYRSGELLARVKARLALPVGIAPASALPNPAPSPAPVPAEPRRANRRHKEDEAVFMSDSEELSLLRMSSPAAPGESQDRTEVPAERPSTLGGQLRYERMRRQMTFVQIENVIKVRLSYLQAMEDNKFTLLPRGPAALHMVRAYAEHLGMDANTVVEEFRANHYVDANATMPTLAGSRPARQIPRWLLMLVAVILALAIGIAAIAYFDPQVFENLGAQIEAWYWWAVSQVFGPAPAE